MPLFKSKRFSVRAWKRARSEADFWADAYFRKITRYRLLHKWCRLLTAIFLIAVIRAIIVVVTSPRSRDAPSICTHKLASFTFCISPCKNTKKQALTVISHPMRFLTILYSTILNSHVILIDTVPVGVGTDVYAAVVVQLKYALKFWF